MVGILAPAKLAEAMRRLNDLYAVLPPHISRTPGRDRLGQARHSRPGRARPPDASAENRAAYREILGAQPSPRSDRLRPRDDRVPPPGERRWRRPGCRLLTHAVRDERGSRPFLRPDRPYPRRLGRRSGDDPVGARAARFGPGALRPIVGGAGGTIYNRLPGRREKMEWERKKNPSRAGVSRTAGLRDRASQIGSCKISARGAATSTSFFGRPRPMTGKRSAECGAAEGSSTILSVGLEPRYGHLLRRAPRGADARRSAG